MSVIDRCIFCCALLALSLASARAESKRVAPGQTLTLDADLVLGVADSLDVAGTADKPCLIIGNQHQIRTADNWKGRIIVAHARVKGLGTGAIKPEVYGIVVRAAGDASVTIADTLFEESAGVSVTNNGNSTASFIRNTIAANCVVPVNKDIGASRECFVARGNSPAKKLFQANRVFRGHAEFESPGWTIGGDTDADSNLFIGLRVKLKTRGVDTVIRGNYLHVLMPRTTEYPYWSQVSTVDPGQSLMEHNVVRDGEWIVQFTENELRYNLICDINDHNLMRNGSVGKVHHNIFHVGKPDHPPGSMGGFIFLVYPPKAPGGGMEIYNNTFDGCGSFVPPGIEMNERTFVSSLRNNAFVNMRVGQFGKLPNAVVNHNFHEKEATGVDRLGYADYNLFHNPDAKFKRHYALGVAGKTVRKDAGFALNDVPRGGEVDAEVEPKFKAPLATFPFDDADIITGRVTVSQMLARYREAYTPANGSPLIDAGDPADGAGADIGAVGAGKANDADRFGRFALPAK